MTRDDLGTALDALAATLPPGGAFRFETPPEGLWLTSLYVPPGRRGGGTAFLARVLAEADRAGVTTYLHADPTDEPGDPSTFELARWYARLGFEVTGVTEDEWIVMARAPRPTPDGDAILADYARARARPDRGLSNEAFHEAYRRGVEACEAPSRGPR